MSAAVRVLCVDDNRLVVEAMRRAIGAGGRLTWAGSVDHPSQVGAALAHTAADVVVLDVDIPGADTFGLVRSLASQFPSVRVVMFSGHVHSEYINRAIDAGAWGYVSKNENVRDVLDAIQRVAEGEFVITPDAEAEQARSG